jgi:leader peptidase (prepilin peptidase)/N-methyltransferase
MKVPDAKAWVRIALVLLAVTFVTYMVFIPTVDAILSSFREKTKKIMQVQNDMTFSEQIRFRTIEGMTAFWFFAYGAAIGSFLNVVVYRMPLGESLAFKRSRCPMCGTQISGRDNIPILGWLMLGGRCRACGVAISLRYPTIELIVGLLFLLLYFVELISGGVNLPIRRPNDYAGVVWIIFYTKWDMVTIYLFHCAMLSMLLALALIDLDGKRLPLKSLILFALLLAVPACLFPHLLLVKIPVSSFGVAMPTWAQAPATILGGAIAGLFGAIAIAFAVWRGASRVEIHFVLGLMLVGISLGWQAVLETLVITVILKLGWSIVSRWSPRKELPDSVNSEVSDIEDTKSALEPELEGVNLRSDMGSDPTRVRGRSLQLSMFLFNAAVIHQVAWRWVFDCLKW